jgi:hypothetical protein
MAVDKPCSIVIRSFSLITDAQLKWQNVPNLLDPPPRLPDVIKQGFITCFGSRTGVLPSYLVPTYIYLIMRLERKCMIHMG